MKSYSKEGFHEKLREADWISVIECEDVDSAWNTFKSLFINTLDQIAPLKEIRLKQKSEPWFDDSILNSIRKRDTLFSTFKRSNNTDIYNEYKKERNNTQRLIDDAKRMYFSAQLEEGKNCPKKIWKTLKELGQMFNKIDSNRITEYFSMNTQLKS